MFRALLLLILASGFSTNAQPVISEADSVISPDAFDGTTIQKLDNERLTRLPFRENMAEYYQLFSAASVVDYQQQQNVHVLGGRADENAYYFEGIDTRSMLTGRNLIRFIPEALAQIELNAGSDAELSHSPSAFFHHLNTPSQKFRLLTAAESDGFTGSGQSRLGTYSYGYRNLLMMTEGYLPQTPIGFVAAMEQRNFDDHYRRFWEGATIDGDIYTNFFTGETLEEQSGVGSIDIKPGNIPYADASSTTVNALMTMDYDRVRLKLVGAFNREQQRINNSPVSNFLVGEHIPEQKDQALALSLQGAVDLGRDVTMNLQYDNLHASTDIYNPVFEDDLLAYVRDYPPPYYNVGLFRFNGPRAIPHSPEKSKEDMQQFRIQFNGTVRQHSLSAGAFYQKRLLRRYSSSIASLRYLPELLDGSAPDYGYNVARSWANEIFGYDVYGNELDDNTAKDEGARRPSQTGFWMQDRITRGSYRLTMGLRYDRFSSDALTINDPENIGLLFYNYLFEDDTRSLVAETKAVGVLSPRLSLEGVFNKYQFAIRWGHYAQPAAQEEFYASRDFFQRRFSGIFQPTTRTFSFEPVRTSLASGYVYRQFTPQIKTGLTVFYRSGDHYPQVAQLTSVVSPGDTLRDRQLVNNGTMSSRGFGVDVEWKTNVSNVYLDYQFSKASGTSSYPNSNNWRVIRSPYQSPAGIGSNSLEFQQDHRLNLQGIARTPASAPVLLQNLELMTRLHANSGHYQPVFEFYSGDREGDWLTDDGIRSRDQLVDTPTTPWVYWMDLGLSRTFNVTRMVISPYFYIENLFNRKNVQNVYVSTGTTEDAHDQNIYFADENDRELYDILNVQYREHLTGNGASDIFMRPRQIRFGIFVEWGTTD